MTTITVPTVPVAQPRQRQRVVNTGGRQYAQNYTPVSDPVNTFKAAVQRAWADETDVAPLDGPVMVTVMFVFARPKCRSRTFKDIRIPHITKPDSDNLQKAFFDALNGMAWHDDKQICSINCTKMEGRVGEQPHVMATVQEWPGYSVAHD